MFSCKFILKDRIWRGSRYISEDVSFDPALNMLTYPGILFHIFLYARGIPLAKDYLISVKV